MTWLSWGVEGIPISSSSASDLSGEVRLSFAGTVSTVSALLVMGDINALVPPKVPPNYPGHDTMVNLPGAKTFNAHPDILTSCSTSTNLPPSPTTPRLLSDHIDHMTILTIKFYFGNYLPWKSHQL